MQTERQLYTQAPTQSQPTNVKMSNKTATENNTAVYSHKEKTKVVEGTDLSNDFELIRSILGKEIIGQMVLPTSTLHFSKCPMVTGYDDRNQKMYFLSSVIKELEEKAVCI